MKHYSVLPQMNGNLPCAIDIETTGGYADEHEIIQIGIQPLDENWNPTLEPFYTNVKPLKPETAAPEATAVHGLSIDDLIVAGVHPDQVREDFERWMEKLDLAFARRIIMIAHNGQFEVRFLSRFFGDRFFNEAFNANTRDSMSLAIGINDRAVEAGRKPPFERVSLTYLSRVLGVKNPHAHDALHDAIASAEVYKKLLNYEELL